MRGAVRRWLRRSARAASQLARLEAFERRLRGRRREVVVGAELEVRQHGTDAGVMSVGVVVGGRDAERRLEAHLAEHLEGLVGDARHVVVGALVGGVRRGAAVDERTVLTKSDKLSGELNPEEEQRFADYLNKKANELSQFALQNR